MGSSGNSYYSTLEGRELFCFCCCCCCLPPFAWGRSWIMCLVFFLTPGLPVMPHGDPLGASLLHLSRERPSAEVAEAGAERNLCDSGVFGGEQQVSVRVWMGPWGSAGKLSCIPKQTVQLQGKCVDCVVFFSWSCSLNHDISMHVVAPELRLQRNGHFWPAANCRCFCALTHKLHIFEPKFRCSC